MVRFSYVAIALSLVGVAFAQTGTPTQLSPSASSAAVSASAAAATASTNSETSNVQGISFDRYICIYLENTDFDKAAQNPDMQYLAQFGLTLTEYYSVTHPSEPNYVAVVGGDYFGIGDDDLRSIPAPVASVVDILEEGGISWGEYQEDMPYTGFTGYNYTNPATDYVDYVRKHDPLIMFDTVANVPSRAANIKNFTLFYEDLANNKLPQWSFITPNMLNDGHDTTIDYASNWTRSFLTPLLNNTNFNDNKTLIIVTFDENETYTIKNNVWTLLLGNAVPPSLRNQTDSTFYTHYSQLSTVQANWALYNLGRGDATPPNNNVFSFVATAANWTNVDVTSAQIPYNNFTATGYFDLANPAPIPAVITNYTGPGGKGIWPSLNGVNGSAINPPSSSTSASSSSSGSGSAAATSKSAAVQQFPFSASVLVALVCISVAFLVGLVA